ncbi:hypothetical protein M2360_002073 [Rhizobium sp. SG_E_25_P2]|uniref:flagellar biosynthetic protein FliO n=1 Tax=Rhizobium sp. SG_E_25_P2 TaxID=2879942 RepID=UPI0024744911|nr:flagellar biosynthetic protein FliO [Rhizobium sp. SG_E_25_P2]MDH6266677.1 hypothetical protein [Rhizobium sp. SG_E_25_P2]
MLDGLAPDLAPRLVIAIGGVAIALVAFIVVLIFLKKRNSPLFIKGGRAREHRLHVLDAAAVDAKRRLVLIRRDDTEHLIMIGGPTDIVIETGIIPGRPLSGEIAQIPAPAPVAIAAEPRPNPQIPPPQPQPQRRVEPPRQPEPPRVAAPAAQAERPRETPKATPAVAPPVPPAPQAQSRPAQAEQPSARPVEPRISNMGAMLYDEGREPFAGANAPLSSMSAAQAQKAQQISAPATASQADAILEQARGRVLQSSPAAETPARRIEQPRADFSASDARLEAMRAEAAAKLEAARQAQITPAPRPAQPAARPQAGLPAPSSSQDRLASDFASFLEAELEAGGVLAEGSRAPGAPQSQPGGGSAEQAVNRRLGEINVNKTDPA